MYLGKFFVRVYSAHPRGRQRPGHVPAGGELRERGEPDRVRPGGRVFITSKI